MLESLFEAFDSNGSGYIDQQEFILGLATLTGGSHEEKIRLCFRTADTSNDGEQAFPVDTPSMLAGYP
jgi:Ca2+-binding EF-hand superfamily protein